MSNKKLLVLAGVSVHSKVVRAAKEMGIHTIVTDYLDPKDSPAKQIADEYLMFDIFDIDRLSDYVIKNKIDGVIDFCIDPAQKPAQAIAEKAGLPMFGTKEQVRALTDKVIFKHLCKQCGVGTIPTYTMDDVISHAVPFPALVKPVDSRGSRGITKCIHETALFEAIETAEKESSNGGFIIEKFMGPEKNQDLTISYLVKDGEPTLVSLGDRHSGREGDNLDRQLVCTLQPSRYIKEYLKYADYKIKDLIRKIGIQNGPVFFQGYWDGEDVRLYDPGIRYPGNEYEQILDHATGVNLMKSLISYCVGGEIEGFEQAKGCYDLGGKICAQYMINVGPGTIARFEGLDAIAMHPDVLDVTQKHFVGETIRQTGDIRHRAGEISVLCKRDFQELKSIIQFIQSNLEIVDTDGNDMIISPFDTGILDKWYIA